LELEPGTWWRVHSFDAATKRYAADAFNAPGAGNARFSPLVQGATVVPTLYAASSLAGALMETVLHDVPYPSDGHIFDLERVLASTLHASAVRIGSPLKVVDLTKLGLQRMGIKPSQMLETDADDYSRTRSWAAWLHDAVPRAQGLVWLAGRHPEARAIMLFGDRVSPGIVQADADPAMRHLRHAEIRELLMLLLGRLGCGVAPDR